MSVPSHCMALSLQNELQRAWPTVVQRLDVMMEKMNETVQLPVKGPVCLVLIHIHYHSDGHT